MSLIKSYGMLQNSIVRAFTVSELLRKNQHGVKLPPTQISVIRLNFDLCKAHIYMCNSFKLCSFLFVIETYKITFLGFAYKAFILLQKGGEPFTIFLSQHLMWKSTPYFFSLCLCSLCLSLSLCLFLCLSFPLSSKCCKMLTLVCYNCILYERSFSNNMISFEVIITILEIPIFYSDAHSHYSTITMSDNQVIEKDSITISRKLSTTIALL